MFSKGFGQSLHLSFRRSKSNLEDSLSPEPKRTSALASYGAPIPVSNHLSFICQGDGRKASSKRFQSYRLVGSYEQPWLADKRMGRTRINSIIVYCFMFLGMLISGYICFAKARTVIKYDYCIILDDAFASIDPNTWTHEIQIGGYGIGSFDWTTTDPVNSFVSADGLNIVPTLTNLTMGINNGQISNGYTWNLTTDGTCTSSDYKQCSIRSNSTLGSIIPPVRSARMTTKGKKNIKYGKVEVIAKFPKGDWLWPAIWVMPENDVHGVWPRSGEIDIAEARGNAPGYLDGGRDTYTSTLHWGPSSENDGFWRTTDGKALRRTDFNEGYHKFGLEWSENYLFTYLDFQLQVFSVSGHSYREFTDARIASSIPGLQRPEKPLATRRLRRQSENNTLLVDPWSGSGDLNAPFDQSFYLILNVAVGSRNGWFPDGIGNKPWVDAGDTSARDFWNAADAWLPTWGEPADRSMIVKSVKMWQEGACH